MWYPQFNSKCNFITYQILLSWSITSLLRSPGQFITNYTRLDLLPTEPTAILKKRSFQLESARLWPTNQQQQRRSQVHKAETVEKREFEVDDRVRGVASETWGKRNLTWRKQSPTKVSIIYFHSPTKPQRILLSSLRSDSRRVSLTFKLDFIRFSPPLHHFMAISPSQRPLFASNPPAPPQSSAHASKWWFEI